MQAEQIISQQLNRYPGIKRGIKRLYQRVMYNTGPEDHVRGRHRAHIAGRGRRIFFGYYDKSPWDATGRYMLCLKAKDTWTNVAPAAPAELLLVDTEDENLCRALAVTHCWNVQQGCMMQWLGPRFDREIIYAVCKLHGASAIVCACSRNEREFEQENVFYAYVDVRDSEACRALYERVMAEQGRIDIPVSDAGITADGMTVKMGDLAFDRCDRHKPEGRIQYGALRGPADGAAGRRFHHYHQQCRGRSRQHRSGQLRGLQGWGDWHEQELGKGVCPQGRTGARQCSRTWVHHDGYAAHSAGASAG